MEDLDEESAISLHSVSEVSTRAVADPNLFTHLIISS